MGPVCAQQASNETLSHADFSDQLGVVQEKLFERLGFLGRQFVHQVALDNLVFFDIKAVHDQPLILSSLSSSYWVSRSLNRRLARKRTRSKCMLLKFSAAQMSLLSSSSM